MKWHRSNCFQSFSTPNMTKKSMLNSQWEKKVTNYTVAQNRYGGVARCKNCSSMRCNVVFYVRKYHYHKIDTFIMKIRINAFLIHNCTRWLNKNIMLLIEIALIHSVMNLNLSNARNVTIDGDRLREQEKCASNFLSNAKRLSRFILCK